MSYSNSRQSKSTLCSLAEQTCWYWSVNKHSLAVLRYRVSFGCRVVPAKRALNHYFLNKTQWLMNCEIKTPAKTLNRQFTQCRYDVCNHSVYIWLLASRYKHYDSYLLNNERLLARAELPRIPMGESIFHRWRIDLGYLLKISVSKTLNSIFHWRCQFLSSLDVPGVSLVSSEVVVLTVEAIPDSAEAVKNRSCQKEKLSQAEAVRSRNCDGQKQKLSRTEAVRRRSCFSTQQNAIFNSVCSNLMKFFNPFCAYLFWFSNIFDNFLAFLISFRLSKIFVFL